MIAGASATVAAARRLVMMSPVDKNCSSDQKSAVVAAAIENRRRGAFVPVCRAWAVIFRLCLSQFAVREATRGDRCTGPRYCCIPSIATAMFTSSPVDGWFLVIPNSERLTLAVTSAPHAGFLVAG